MARVRRVARAVVWGTALALASAGSAAPDSSERGEAPTAARADSDGLAARMSVFAASGGVRATFREQRYLSLLDQPIESRGELYFAPPDRLARVTREPGHARVVVRGDRVAFEDELGHQTLDLAASEVARSLVGNLRVLLRGDTEALHERYEVAYREEGERWVLDLTPRSRVVRGLVERIRVVGTGPAMQQIETLEASGDRTVLHFLSAETGVEFSAEEEAALFSLEARDSTP